MLLALPLTSAHAASVTLAWDANSEPDLAGYKLYYGTSAGPPYSGNLANEGPSPVDIPLSALTDPQNPEYTLTGIPSCTHLYLAATAYDTSANESGYSTPVDATIVAKPTAVTATDGGQSGSLLVSWTGLPFGDTGTITGFRVHYGTTSGQPYQGSGADQGSSPVVVGPGQTSLLLTGLTVGTTLFIAVEATCSDGAGNLSTETSATVSGPSCGNGVVEPGETCDPPGSCPSSCGDGNACTTDTLIGDPWACSSSCSHTPVTQCWDGDGCCPPGCNGNTDDDCSPSCGNDV
jgi:hypothetical protein